jgi:hypothetical protein
VRNPYVTGAYVTGARFYGRDDVVDHLLNGSGSAYWVIGTRRIGKTSLLRELARRTSTTAHRCIPLYWDMQGSDSMLRLGQYLSDAVGDAAPRLDALRLGSSMASIEDPLRLLTALRRAVSAAGRELLLLCDETEVLVGIARKEAEGAQALHGLLTGGQGIRAVMTGTRAVYQLNDASAGWPTSPFLAGFDLSQTLGSLSPAAARNLVLQTQQQPVRAAPGVIASISEHTNNHPYLVQLLCSRLFRPDGSLRAVEPDDMRIDPVLDGFFRNDFAQLTQADRDLVLAVRKAKFVKEFAIGRLVKEEPAELAARLRNLEALGYLRRDGRGLTLGNRFLAAWLASRAASVRKIAPAKASEEAVRQGIEAQQAQESAFLLGQLANRRARLVELEVLRARDLLETRPQVLGEIEGVQDSIRELRRLLAAYGSQAAS